MILNLVNHLPTDRWETRVCCIHSDGPIGREMRAAGHAVVTLGRTPGLRDPLAVLTLVREIRRFRPHIVQTLLLTGNLYGRLAALLSCVPVVVSTEVNVQTGRKWRHLVVERALAHGTDAVVASAESVKREYVRDVGMPADRVEVVYSAVDWDRLQTTASRAALRRDWDLPTNVLVAGVIARLTEQKGLTYLLDAMAKMVTSPELVVVIVGDGPLRSELELRASALGLGSRVRFLGARRDLGNLLSVMDIFVLPSLWEGLPLSLILAMGAGLPVVATSVAGIPEVVADGITGLLVPPANASALGAALGGLVEDAETRMRLGRAAQEFVRPRFSIARCVEAMTALYERLLQERVT